MPSLNDYLILAAILFAIGTAGVLLYVVIWLGR